MKRKTARSVIVLSACLLVSAVPARGKDASKAVFIAECDLQQAIDIAVKNNSELKAAALDLDAAEARIRQAGLWANPALEFESENFSGDNPGFSRAENTASISQPLLLGGKIKHQKNIARMEKAVAHLQHEAAKIDVIAKVEEAVYEILLAQQNLTYAMEAREIAQHLYEASTRKGNTHDASPQSLIAEIELAQAVVEVMDAEKSLAVAKNNLAVLWGGALMLTGDCKGDLDREFNVPAYDETKKCLLENNPEIKMMALQKEKGDVLVQAAKADRVPDVEAGLGMRRFEEDDTYAMVARLSVPLPMFNRNQGSIQEALIRQKQAAVEEHALTNRLLFELDEAYRTFEAAQRQVDIFKKSILPKTESLFALNKQRYQGGAIEYLEVLEAQRTLVETHRKYMELLKTLQNAVANLERLCATRFHGSKGEMF